MLASQPYGRGRTRDLVGANMAFDRSVLKRVTGFDQELGPGRLGFGEDTLFARQLVVDGHVILHGDDDTTIEHHFDPSRLTPRAFRESAARRGRSKAYIAVHWGHDEPSMRRLRALTATARAAVETARSPFRRAGTADDGVLTAIQRMAYLSQVEIELARGRKYTKQGLSKRSA